MISSPTTQLPPTRGPLVDCTHAANQEANLRHHNDTNGKVKPLSPTNMNSSTSSDRNNSSESSPSSTTPNAETTPTVVRMHNPYPVVIPQTPEALLAEIHRVQRVNTEARQRRTSIMMRGLSSSFPPLYTMMPTDCCSPHHLDEWSSVHQQQSSIPILATTPQFLCQCHHGGSCSSMNEDEITSAPTAPPHLHHPSSPSGVMNCSHGHHGGAAAAAASSSHQSSPASRIPPSAILVKVYQNGRPVPKMRNDGTPATTPSSHAQTTVTVTAAAPPPPPEREQRLPQNTRVVVQLRVARATFTMPNPSSLQMPTRRHALHTYVIVEGDRGIDLGQIVEVQPTTSTQEKLSSNNNDTSSGSSSSAGNVQRIAADEEVNRYLESLPLDDKRALEFARQQAAKLLPNKLIITRAAFQFDRKKLTLWYRSADRVYFVPLLKAMNAQYKCRIWMIRAGGDDEDDDDVNDNSDDDDGQQECEIY